MLKNSLILFFVVTVIFSTIYTPQAILPMLQEEFHISMAQTNLLLSGMLFVLMFITPFYALVANRFEKKKIMMVAIFFLFLSVLLSALATSYYGLLLSRLMQGIFIPGITAIMLSYIQEIYPQKHRGLGMGIYMAATGFGAVVGRLLAGWITYFYSYQEAFGLFSLLLLLALTVMAWGLPTTLLATNFKVKHYQDSIWKYLKKPKISSLLLIPMVVFFSFMAMTTFITYHLAEAPFLLTSYELGNMFLILLLAVIISPIAGKLSDRFGRVKILLFGITSLIVGIILTLSSSVLWIVIGIGFVTIGMFIVQSVTPTYLGDLVPEDRARVGTLYQTFFYLGGAMGTLLPAIAWGFGEYNGVVMLCLGILFLGISPLMYINMECQYMKKHL